jgi:hypothetical protein
VLRRWPGKNWPGRALRWPGRRAPRFLRITDLSDRSSAAAQDSREYLAVRLVRGVPTEIYAGATGYALPFARQGAHATVFYDRVENLSAASVGPRVSSLLGRLSRMRLDMCCWARATTPRKGL